jgi:hypothetical protein
MRALLVAAILTCVLSFETFCSAQTMNSKSEIQSTAVRETKAGHTCTFQGRDDMETFPNCVLQDGHGNLLVAPDYVNKMRFDSNGLAALWDYDDPRQKFMYVDQSGHVVIQGVPIFDNWAAEFSEGLVQTVINGKIGFADRHGKIVIAPKYDGADSFKDGYAVVCIGCREACIMPDDPTGNLESDCEHRTMTGGEWLKINKAGRVVAKASQYNDKSP